MVTRLTLRLPDPVTGFRPVSVLVVAEEWSSAHGGVSSFNRSLCCGLAAAGAAVTCSVPRCSPEERANAASYGVSLIEARPLPGASDGQLQMRRPRLPWAWTPDLVYGHDRFTGPAALSLIEDHFPKAEFVPIFHVVPDDLAPWRQDRAEDPAQLTEYRVRLQFELATRARQIVAVGPNLYERMRRDLSVSIDAPQTLRIDPGFDHGEFRRRTPPPGRPIQVLVMGRVNDYRIKGVDLAVKALARALRLRGRRGPDVELLVRGAPPGESAAIESLIRGWAPSAAFRVTVRPFTTDNEALQQDLLRASLVLMPSRADSLGLVGVEAIVAGAPVLISNQAGLGVLLEEMPHVKDAAGLVVPVTFDEQEDVERWAHKIAAALEYLPDAFARADRVKRALATELTWAGAAERLLAAHGGLARV